MKKRRWIALLLCFIMLMSDAIPVFATNVKNQSEVVWTSKDFTYGTYEKDLYGCDYTRQIKVKGVAITGFSESGEEKLTKSKDLVIPSVDDEGYAIVGIAGSAFKGKGLTSVVFPTGMMVDYDDTITHKVTKRGNFVIAENAFSGNQLTSVVLPEGVIAVLSNAFMNNKIETVKLPKTIWWLETQAFSKNRITTVNFPTTCDFQLEMHGMTFANNFIKSVRLPDYTEVVNKDAFILNTGMEPIEATAKDTYKTYIVDGVKHDAGVVYMYTDNAELEGKDRIHHTGKETASQKSYVQKLVVTNGSGDTNLLWNISDFTVDGTTITGLSDSGIDKRKTNKHLVIPEFNKDGQYITEIGSAPFGGYGLFASETEKFESVYLPSGVKIIGNFAFQNNDLKEVTFPSKLEKIGNVAFQTNNLTSVILPNSVTSLGSGVFATNPKLERISLSKGLTKIPDSAFGCSDGDNWMDKLTSIELHEGITEIGSRAFAGNNFSKIEIPSTVTSIGSYAFSTKNYLNGPCEVILQEGLKTIGADAFRNKVISEIELPTTVTKLHKNTFRKEYSDSTQALVTKVYVSSKTQYEDTKNFPTSDYHKVYLTDTSVWTAEDFTYGEESVALYPASEYSSTNNITVWVVKGFSEQGEGKLSTNKELVIPAKDPTGRVVEGVGANAFKEKGITKLTLPEGVMTQHSEDFWKTDATGIAQRGNFYILSGAFRKNKLTSLELPEGVIYVGGNAFKQNQLSRVIFPKTLMFIGNASFAQNQIQLLSFTESTDFALNIDTQAFAVNQISAVQLPVNTEKVTKWAFMQNTGMEPVTSGTASEKKGGIVYMYKADATGNYIDHIDNKKSNVQKLIVGTTPSKYTSWNEKDFTYDVAGTSITGLSNDGKDKIKINPRLELPKVGLTGEKIVALGDGANNVGIFVYSEGDKNYTPASIVLPDSLTKIGKWTFALNTTLTYEAEMKAINLPDGLVEIGQTAFQNSKLESVSIPDSVTTMGIGSFTGSANLKEVKLSRNVEVIPQSAFASAIELKNIAIPEGVKEIGKQAFAGTHVEELSLPSTLVEIEQRAFENHNLVTLEIPSNVKNIGKYAFRVNQEGYTGKLKTLVLHEGLLSIGQEAFVGSAIEEVTLPSTTVLSTIDKAADCIFGNKSKPAEPIVVVRVSDESKVNAYNTSYANNYSHRVIYDELLGSGWNHKDFTYDEGTATITGWSESGQVKRTQLRELVLPDTTPDGKTIVAVGEGAFKIPDNEVVITKFGIYSPNGMRSVKLPNGIQTIGKEAFSQNALTEVDLKSVTEIGYRAFYGNDLVKVQIPDTVTKLGDGAFATNDIKELKLSSGVTIIPKGVFSMNIHLESIEIPDTVTEIGATAFAGARLTSLTIPKSVEKIGEKAFHLHHLSSLTIPGNVKEIGESAFEGTYKATTLTKLVIEEGVEYIGKFAFKEALLETVYLPNSIKKIGEKPFLNNSGKDGSHVVEIITKNYAHLSFVDDSYSITYAGIWPISAYENSIKLSADAVPYTGTELKPTVSIEGLTEGKDFVVSYKNNIEVGTATVVVTGVNGYNGEISKTFVITSNPFVAENEQLKADKEQLQAEIDRLNKQLNSHKCETKIVEKVVEKDTPVEKEVAAAVEQKEVPKQESKQKQEVKDKSTEELKEKVVSGKAETGNNQLIVGIVIGALVGGCIVYLLCGKKKIA
ncbi:MAG: leucine-rich repeat protein [Clostridium cadaveris]|nr:leucine-rich repeat protein [Clostridium cadaveris]